MAGSNVPVVALVIPVPLHVPPGVAALSVTAAAVLQNGPAGVMLASAVPVMVMVVVAVSPQEPGIKY